MSAYLSNQINAKHTRRLGAVALKAPGKIE